MPEQRHAGERAPGARRRARAVITGCLSVAARPRIAQPRSRVSATTTASRPAAAATAPTTSLTSSSNISIEGGAGRTLRNRDIDLRALLLERRLVQPVDSLVDAPLHNIHLVLPHTPRPAGPSASGPFRAAPRGSVRSAARSVDLAASPWDPAAARSSQRSVADQSQQDSGRSDQLGSRLPQPFQDFLLRDCCCTAHRRPRPSGPQRVRATSSTSPRCASLRLTAPHLQPLHAHWPNQAALQHQVSRHHHHAPFHIELDGAFRPRRADRAAWRGFVEEGVLLQPLDAQVERVAYSITTFTNAPANSDSTADRAT